MMPTAVPKEFGADSFCTLSVLSGPSITLWSMNAGVDTAPERRLRLSPNRPAIIGRAEGWHVPYLDPAYMATTVVPGTGQTVLLDGGRGADISVSRGHFMLRAAAEGILLVNGVPKVGGGIRPPINGTYLLSPQNRKMEPAEEYMIVRGEGVVLFLPNQAQIQITAG